MFIQVIQARCSRPEELREFARSWKDELGPGADGWLGGTFGVTDDGIFLGVVRFASRAAAEANSARPEQGAWAEKMGSHLDGPPDFTDYDDVTEFLDGGTDTAGFVQIIRGHVDDVTEAKGLINDPGDLQEMRPEVLGGTFAVDANGDYTETIYFTDEASARAGERDVEPPEEVRVVLEKMMAGASFYDLRSPWFESA